MGKARAMVTRLAEEADDSFNKPSEDNGDSINDTMDFPVNATGSIIGSRGVKIAEVRHNSGAKVQVEKGENSCKVLLSGTPDQIERAKKMVRILVNEGQDRASGRRGGAEESMDVEKSLVGRVIGKGGETIQ